MNSISVSDMHTIAVAAAKGGSGKSTTTINLAEYFSQDLNLETVIIDIDQQANSSSFYEDIDKIEEHNILTLLQKESTIEEALIKVHENLYLIPSTLQMTNFDSLFGGVTGKELMIRSMLEPLLREKGFNVCIFDTHADLNTLQGNSLFMANTIIIPVVVGSAWDLHGLDLLLNKIADIKEGALGSFVRVTNIFIIPTMAQKISLKDWKELKVVGKIFPECKILPEISFYGNTKHYLAGRVFKKNKLYKDYKKSMEGLTWK